MIVTTEVCTSVAEGGAEEAVKVDVATGGRELAGGAAEDCAGGGALEVGGAADDCAGGFEDWGAAGDDGAGDAGVSAEEGVLLEGGAAGEEGAGAAEVLAVPLLDMVTAIARATSRQDRSRHRAKNSECKEGGEAAAARWKVARAEKQRSRDDWFQRREGSVSS